MCEPIQAGYYVKPFNEIPNTAQYLDMHIEVRSSRISYKLSVFVVYGSWHYKPNPLISENPDSISGMVFLINKLSVVHHGLTALGWPQRFPLYYTRT